MPRPAIQRLQVADPGLEVVAVGGRLDRIGGEESLDAQVWKPVDTRGLPIGDTGSLCPRIHAPVKIPARLDACVDGVEDRLARGRTRSACRQSQRHGHTTDCSEPMLHRNVSRARYKTAL